MTLGPIGARWLENRGILEETAVRFGVYTASGQKKSNVQQDENGKILVFPYVDQGRVVNEKFRVIVPDNKHMWQRKGARKTFWNVDVMDDPSLLSGHVPLIITEGEPDALAAIQSGFPFAVSVPDGAPPEGSVFDGNDDSAGKFEFVFNNMARLKRIPRFILAVDGDKPGQALAEELVRRLFASRCSSVKYPEGTKDLNDVLLHYGSQKVAEVLNSARPYPCRGLYRLTDYPDVGPLKTFKTGWATVDDIFLIKEGEFIVVTGVPSHGKSAFMLHLLVNLAELHGWHSAIFSPEMDTVPVLRDTLRRIRSRKEFLTGPECDDVEWWINQHFCFIDADATGNEEDEEFDLDWIIARATEAVVAYGIKVLVIDCWNEIEHARKKGELITDYIGRSIRDLKRFAKLHGVTVIVIAHPTKDVWDNGKSRVPSLYDIENSAHWFNKSDHGLVIERPNPDGNEAVIHMAKVRFRGTGRKGSVRMMFDPHTDRFEMLAQM